MNNKNLNFIYISTHKRISIQSISNIKDDDTYIQGISALESDYGRIKTFRKDRMIDFYDSIEEAQAAIDLIVNTIDPDSYIYVPPKPSTFDVHFTGFKKDVKLELEALSSKAEITVRKSVTKSLNLLCYGYNASENKMSEARDMGIIILNEERFRHFLETGDFTDSL